MCQFAFVQSNGLDRSETVQAIENLARDDSPDRLLGIDAYRIDLTPESCQLVGHWDATSVGILQKLMHHSPKVAVAKGAEAFVESVSSRFSSAEQLDIRFVLVTASANGM